MSRRRKTGLCPCGSRSSYPACCGRYVDGAELPETPDVLMRSRYSAYAVGDVDYIVNTTDPEGEAWEEDEVEWRESVAQFARRCDFYGVDILSCEVDGDRGTVKFHAKLKRARADTSFTELSYFVRQDGRWLYTSGESMR